MGAFTCGIRLHDLEPAPLERRFERAAELGYSCVHLASKVVYQEYGIDSSGLTRDLADRLRAALGRCGLTVAVFGCYQNLAQPDGPGLERTLDDYGRCARFAAWLGAGVVGTETGRPNAQNRIDADRFAEGALERFCANARRAAALCADEGVLLALEPGYNEVVCTPERCRRALDAIGDDAVGVIYDAVSLLHPALLKGPRGAAAARDQVARMLELCGDRIRVLHAKDYALAPAREGAGWADETGLRLVCHGAGETGSFDFAPLAAWARANRPGIPCVVENSTPDTAAACLAYLQGL